MTNSQQYETIVSLFQHYNKKLFCGSLPEPMFTVSKLPNVASGVFLSKKWSGQAGLVHQITINPEIMKNKSLHLFHQVLVHEMAHLWQHEYGKPSRNGYHNREWAAKMVEIGLIPSHTGEEGGKLTGQRISDYPKPGGKFLQAFSEVKNIKIPFEYK